jgi:NTP pyrophosphatase (non-canonical NTP hydrolase)
VTKTKTKEKILLISIKETRKILGKDFVTFPDDYIYGLIEELTEFARFIKRNKSTIDNYKKGLREKTKQLKLLTINKVCLLH